jgi:hypothetical protein
MPDEPWPAVDACLAELLAPEDGALRAAREAAG